jgi:hypothetical protein
MEDASANAQVRKLKTLLRKAEDKVLNHDKVIWLNFFPAVLRCGKVFSHSTVFQEFKLDFNLCGNTKGTLCLKVLQVKFSVEIEDIFTVMIKSKLVSNLFLS